MIARDHKPTTLLRGSFVALPLPDTPGPSPRPHLSYVHARRSLLSVHKKLTPSPAVLVDRGAAMRYSPKYVVKKFSEVRRSPAPMRQDSYVENRRFVV